MGGEDLMGSQNFRRLIQGGNGRVVRRFAAITAMTLFFASFLPKPLVPVMITNLMLLTAIVSSGVALLRRERTQTGELCRWDEAAAYFMISMIAAFFVDPAAIEALLPMGEGAPLPMRP